MLVEIDKKNTFFKIVYGVPNPVTTPMHTATNKSCYTWVPKDSYLYKGMVDDEII